MESLAWHAPDGLEAAQGHYRKSVEKGERERETIESVLVLSVRDMSFENCFTPYAELL